MAITETFLVTLHIVVIGIVKFKVWKKEFLCLIYFDLDYNVSTSEGRGQFVCLFLSSCQKKKKPLIKLSEQEVND